MSKTKGVNSKKKPEKEPKRVGRPTKYFPGINKQVYNFSLLGASNEQIAGFLEISVDTFYQWKEKYPAFSEALANGRENADSLVAKSLFQRAIGYKHKANKIQLHRDGTFKKQEYTEVYPPDTNAAMFWLKNRKSDKWREKLEVSQTTIKVKVQGEDEPENEGISQQNTSTDWGRTGFSRAGRNMLLNL